MPGFLVGCGKSQKQLTEVCLNRVISDEYSSDSFFALRSTLNKFMNDKCFVETNHSFLVLDGYLLNKHLLLREYTAETLEELVDKMYLLNGETFFSEFRGCFSGAIYDKVKSKWVIFTNQIGDAPVFYTTNGSNFAAGSQVSYILNWCLEQNMHISFNESCAYQMLSFGYVASDETYANEIKRLHGGDYLVFQNGTLSVKTYHRFTKHKDRFRGFSESDIIEEIDKVFKEAVNLEWHKDIEYGYKHLADLSGGLDSRMNMWVAHEEIDCHATILTYSKEQYLDHIIAKQIASYWADEFVFRPLDDAAFMYDIDINTSLLGGLSLYSGITGGRRLLESLELSKFGIEHTGMVGDIALGSFYHDIGDGEKKRPSGMYSERYKNKLPSSVIALSDNYDDYEVYLMYVRGFHGACNSHLLRRNYTEVGSPFLNVDFMQLCFDISVEMRIGHHIYKKWIINKHPNAAKFKWEKTGGLITETKLSRNIRRYKKALTRRIGKLFAKNKVIAYGMNPIDYWISQDEHLRRFLDNYEEKGYSFLPKTVSDNLINDMKELYRSGTANEKAMVLTVLASAKLYFGDIRNGERTI